jgi:two-component system, OmpR family, sensor histidine kinase QseC
MKVWSRNYSLRYRVLTGLFVATCAYWSVVAAVTVQYNMKELHELYDIHLAHTALALIRLHEPGKELVPVHTIEGATNTIEQLFKKWPDLPEHVTPDNLSNAEKGLPDLPISSTADPFVVDKNVKHGLTLRYQLWRNDGQLLFQSANAPSTTMSKGLGFTVDTDAQGKVWRNYSIWDAQHEVLAVVTEADEDRMELVRSVAISSMNPIVLGMPLFILLMWLSVRRGLGPLTDLCRAIARRDGNSLVQFEENKSPPELQPIVLSLNNLMGRIQQSLEAERCFNANAAHELNTPLAAIQAHLYVARQSLHAAEREQALNQAQAATERGIRLIRQMLALARLGPHACADRKKVNLNELAQDVCAVLFPLATRGGQTLEIVAAAGTMAVSGEADLLHQLLCNLVDNAMRYSPPHSQILLELEATPRGVRLTVTDDGPGIPQEHREQVFNRFFRLADQSVIGSGLGLAICRKIADMHDAKISLSQGPNGKGLSVHLDFPAAD